MYYYHIAKASQVECSQDYLDRAFSKDRFEVIEKAVTNDFGRWHYVLMRDLQTNRAIVAFRGSQGVHNWVSNVKNLFHREQSLLNEIEFQIAAWNESLKQEGYEPISILVGHSRGGQFAYAVNAEDAALRITLNGYNCRTKKNSSCRRVINLRTRGDLITGWPFSKRKHYITLQSLAKKPNVKMRLLQSPHRLLTLAQAMVTDPQKAQITWMRNPVPLTERSWHEIAPRHFLSLASSAQR